MKAMKIIALILIALAIACAVIGVVAAVFGYQAVAISGIVRAMIYSVIATALLIKRAQKKRDNPEPAPQQQQQRKKKRNASSGKRNAMLAIAITFFVVGVAIAFIVKFMGEPMIGTTPVIPAWHRDELAVAGIACFPAGVGSLLIRHKIR